MVSISLVVSIAAAFWVQDGAGKGPGKKGS